MDKKMGVVIRQLKNMKKIVLLLAILVMITGCSKVKILDQRVMIHENDAEYIIKRIHYTSGKYSVEGYITEPAEVEEKLPLLIVLRGSVEIDKRWFSHYSFFASEGYIVAAPNYRGSASSEGINEFGGTEIEDVHNLIEIMKEHPLVDKDRIYVLGYSYGSMMALLTLRERNDITACAIGGTISNVELLYEQNNGFGSLIGGTPDELPKEYKKRSAIYWSDEIDEPLLIVHGSEDVITTLEQSTKLVELLNNEHELIIYDGLNHDETFFKMMDGAFLEWFRKY